MADSFLPVYVPSPLLSTGSKMDSESLTVGANTVERERIQVAGASALEVARVIATTPVGTEMGLVVRLASLNPGTSGTSLGKAVGATAGANDTGIAGLLVRTDALVTLTPADGQYTYGRTDSLGSQWVTLSHMVQAIGSVAHDSADTQPPVKIGGYASAALRTAVTEADRVDASFDLQGQLRVLLGGGVAHDAADSGNPLKVGGVANAALFTAVTEGDRVNASFDLQGQQRVILPAVAHDAADAGNPLKIGGYASAALPTAVSTDGDRVNMAFDLNGRARILSEGQVAHDAVDSGNPHKLGFRAVAHGSLQTAVAASDRTDWISNRHGVPWVIGGHPDVVTLEAAFTAAQTNTTLVAGSANFRIVVTRVALICANSNTVDVAARVGFHATTTPTTTGVVLTHPGLAPGSGYSSGDGSGILGFGAVSDALLITCGVPTTGSVRVLISYYTAAS